MSPEQCKHPVLVWCGSIDFKNMIHSARDANQYEQFTQNSLTEPYKTKQVTFTEINIEMLKTYTYAKACTQVFTVSLFIVEKYWN